MPTPAYVKKTAPEDIRESVQAALDGDADGFVLSRKYSEMRLENLEAVGEVVRGRLSSLAVAPRRPAPLPPAST